MHPMASEAIVATLLYSERATEAAQRWWGDKVTHHWFQYPWLLLLSLDARQNDGISL